VSLRLLVQDVCPVEQGAAVFPSRNRLLFAPEPVAESPAVRSRARRRRRCLCSRLDLSYSLPMAAPLPADDDERVAFPSARIRAEKRHDLLHGALTTTLLALTAVAHFFGGFSGVVAWLGAVVAPALALLAWQRARTPSGGARLEASREGLFSCDKLVVRRADMVRAVVVPEGARALVSVQRRQGFYVVIEAPDEPTAHAIVAALGLSAEQRRAAFLVDSPLATRLPVRALLATLGVSLAAAAVGLFLGQAWTALLLAPWYLFFLVYSRPAELKIGTDGVLLSWLGKKTLIQYSEIVKIIRDASGLCFSMTDGRTVRVGAAWTASLRSRSQPELRSPGAYLDALLDRIRLAKEAAGTADITVLDRGGKPLSDWLLELRALTLRDPKGFRHAPVVPEALWKTVENGQAPPGARAAAAVALQPSLDDAGRARLRVAAATVVAPKLRVALTAAAERDEEALSQALADMESQGPAEAKLRRRT